MANSIAGLGVNHTIVDLTNRKEVREALFSLIDMDNDLTENEDYFQPDTLSLGYESEADRIIDEHIKKHGYPLIPAEFIFACEQVSRAISEQEYYGECDLNIIPLDDSRVSLVFVYGGSYSL